MGNFSFILNYVQSCLSGRFPASECGAVWHLVIIATLVVVMLATLVVLRIRARGQPGAA